MMQKQLVWSLVSIYFDSPQLGIQINKFYNTLDYWSRDMLNFKFLEKGLEIVSPLHFEYDFSGKMFVMLYSINCPNSIAWLSLLEILVNMCTSILFCLLTRLWRHKIWN